VYAADETELFVKFVSSAIAFTVSDALTVIAPVYFVELEVGVLPFVV
jgi:hypothetical protein